MRARTKVITGSLVGAVAIHVILVACSDATGHRRPLEAHPSPARTSIRIDTELHVEHRWVRFGEIGRYLVWRQQLECVKLLDDALTGKTPLSIFHELKTQP